MRLRRREFIRLLGGAAAAWPISVQAQRPVMPVVGLLDCVQPRFVAAFRTGLRDMGFIENRNVTIELRETDQYDRLPALAAELARREVAVIVAACGPAAPAAKAATATIPIVFSIGGDPIELGLVSNLNRPDGNVTGVTFFAAQLLRKQVGLLGSMLPKSSTFGVLVNPNNPRHSADARDVEDAARTLSIKTHVVRAGTVVELVDAFAALRQAAVDAVLVCGDAFFGTNSKSIAALAARHALPTMHNTREYVQAGGLISYGSSLIDAYRQAGTYAGRILRGEKPMDLPVLQPTRFELLINLKTAKALSLELPPTVLALADEVIE